VALSVQCLEMATYGPNLPQARPSPFGQHQSFRRAQQIHFGAPLTALRCGPKTCSAPNPNAEMSNGKTAQGKVKPILGRIKIICALSVLVG